MESMGEEEKGMVRAAVGRLHARVEDEIGESDLEARYNLGIAYKEMGLLDEALQEFATARKRGDLAFSCAVHVAEIHAAKGDFESSFRELDALIGGSSPGSTERCDLLYQKADMLEAAGREAEAGEIFRTLLRENGGYRDIRSRAERYRS
jgi:tetratricopeptide (TPR) repeat protein